MDADWGMKIEIDEGGNQVDLMLSSNWGFLVGGFKYFLFSSLLGEMIQYD